MLDDLLGPSKADIVEGMYNALKITGSQIGAILLVLEQKGLMTVEEFQKAQVMMLAGLDQYCEEHKEEFHQAWREEHPEQAKALDLMEKLFKPKNKDG